MLNQIVLVGRLTADPKIKSLEGGQRVSNLILAVQRDYKNFEGIYETDFIPFKIWNNLADKINEYCHKGDMVGIKGRLQMITIGKVNEQKQKLEVIADKVTFLSSGRSKDTSIE